MSSVITVKDMCLWYGQVQALKNININIEEKSITALIGPSGCGKSTFLKSLNRMNDLVPGVKITGDLRYRGEDIFDPKFLLFFEIDCHLVPACCTGISPFSLYCSTRNIFFICFNGTNFYAFLRV